MTQHDPRRWHRALPTTINTVHQICGCGKSTTGCSMTIVSDGCDGGASVGEYGFSCGVASMVLVFSRG